MPRRSKARHRSSCTHQHRSLTNEEAEEVQEGSGRAPRKSLGSVYGSCWPETGRASAYALTRSRTGRQADSKNGRSHHHSEQPPLEAVPRKDCSCSTSDRVAQWRILLGLRWGRGEDRKLPVRTRDRDCSGEPAAREREDSQRKARRFVPEAVAQTLKP